MSHKLSMTLALSAAALFVGACDKGGAGTKIPDGMVKCMGGNSCSGQSACKVKDSHACKGQNSCQAKGWVAMDPGECDAAGGTAM